MKETGPAAIAGEQLLLVRPLREPRIVRLLLELLHLGLQRSQGLGICDSPAKLRVS